MQATLDTEIRKLQPNELYTLSNILNQSDSWKKLMAIVPRTNGEGCMFNNEHFLMIEQAIRQQQRSGAEIFLSEWSTLNKQRPTCRTMLDLLVKVQLFRAADYLAVEILKGEPPERPQFGPAAPIDVSEKVLEELLKQQAADLQTESNDLPVEVPLSWSLRFAEKPVDVAVGNVEQTKDNAVLSDLMKFSDEKSDLMEFSGIASGSKNSQKVSDLMKFSDNAVAGDIETENYVLKEAQSADIPLCVRENAFNSSTSADPSATFDLTSAALVESTDDIPTTISSETIRLPNISQNVIPIVVLEYNDKEES